MQLEVGSIVEGKVTGITKFGAFVELPTGQTGMVHISEVAQTYVKEIRDHLTENQQVKVKVLTIGADGKISLSIKKAIEAPPRRPAAAPSFNRRPAPAPAPTTYRSEKPGRPENYEWQPTRSDDANFEDMLSKFKQASDEKISDLKRSLDSKHGGFSRRGSR